DEAFYQESELIEGANGERLAPTGAPVEWVEEPSFFFRLSDWQQPLLEFYERHPDFVLPASRMNEVKSFVAGGLKDLSISRTSFSWGVPVPGHPGHIMYVWIDALTNYLSAVDYPDMQSERFRTFWPADLHMVGKDILRFHAVYWPAFLMAAGIEPPRRVFAHGWWTNEGEKISKSLGNVIDPFALVEEFGVDPVRYFLLRAVPFGQDGDFSRTAFVERTNADLANDFGNLAQRVLSMIHKNCEARIPGPGALQVGDTALLAQVDEALGEMRSALDRQAFHQAIEALWRRVGKANQYVAEEQPWVLRKQDPARMRTVLWSAAEAIRRLAILAQPFTPDAMTNLLDQLAVPSHARDFRHLSDPATRLAPGTPIAKPKGVFPRLVLAEDTHEEA
ncbi:MAG: methionine--tRNA ligase, partial [Alphaproteobacteria bacterium]